MCPFLKVMGAQSKDSEELSTTMLLVGVLPVPFPTKRLGFLLQCEE